MTDFSLFKQYGPGIPAQLDVPISFRVNWQIYSEQWLDNLPAQLMAEGMTCQEARDYLSAHYDILINRIIVKRDTVIPCFPDGIDFTYNGTGSPPDYGNWRSRVGIPTDLDTIYLAQDFVAGLPDLSSVTVDGTWDIFNGQVFAAYPSTNPGSIPFNYSAWLPPMERITAIDINKWFCNVTQCCGSGTFGGASQFLIPAPDMPSPVEEKSSIPILNNPLYLANHTWAFRNNFGRIPK